MNLGFIGTGEITRAMVSGLCTPGQPPQTISLSPRNFSVAKALANQFESVSIASSNQDVLDACKTVVIAVRPSIARDVLSELRFRRHHHVISVVSGLKVRSLVEAVAPAGDVTLAVPLPSAARRLSPTAVYPPNRKALELFSTLGTVFPIEHEDEFNAVCAATATIASYIAFAAEISSWLERHGVSSANRYVAQMFRGVTVAAADSSHDSLQAFARSYATPDGINEQVLKHVAQNGLLAGVPEALDAVLLRIS